MKELPQAPLPPHAPAPVGMGMAVAHITCPRCQVPVEVATLRSAALCPSCGVLVGRSQVHRLIVAGAWPTTREG